MRPTNEDIDYAVQIGKNLERILSDRGISQSELARRLGVSRSGINKYVMGLSAPSPRNIMRMASALGVTADDILMPDAEQAPKGKEVWDNAGYVEDNIRKLLPEQVEVVQSLVRSFISLNEKQ